MSPIYAVLAAPLARPLRVPLAPLVHALAATRGRCGSPSGSRRRSSASTERSFPLPSRKVVAIGHGIEVARERRAPRADDGTLRLARARADVAGEGARDRDRGRRAARRRPVEARAARAVADAPRSCTAGARSADRRARARGRVRLEGRCARSAHRRLSTHGATCSSTTCAPARSTRSSTKRRRPGCPSRRERRLRAARRAASSRRSASRRTTRRRSPSASAALRRAGPERRARDRRRAARARRARPLGRALGRARSSRRRDDARAARPEGVRRSRARRRTSSRSCRCCDARGWDARMVVLHEGEPGAARVRRAHARAGRSRPRRGACASTSIRRCRRGSRAGGRTILHTHLVHADVLGLPAGAAARVPVRLSTKHGFNEFRANRLVGRGRPGGGALRPRADRDLARPRRLSRGDRGIRPRRVHGRALRHRAGA